MAAAFEIHGVNGFGRVEAKENNLYFALHLVSISLTVFKFQLDK